MTTEARVIALMASVFQVRADRIHATAAKPDVEGWDSIGHMNLCLALEDEFRVRFTDRHVTGMNSVADVVRTIDELMQSQART
jgi:acyl carrier protein